MKKLFAVLLTLAMLLGLAACTSGGSGAPTIVGAWEGSMDMSAALNSMLQMELGEKINVKMLLTFKEDGKYTFKLDEDSIADASDALIDVMIEMIEELLVGTEGGSLEDALAAEGMTIADLKAQYKQELDLAELLGDSTEEGYYRYEEGKIYTAEDKDDFDEGDYDSIYTVTLLGKTLTITDIETDGESAAELMSDMFPMVFTKQ